VCYATGVGRDDDLEAILDRGRQTRRPPPRGLWIAAAIVGAICAVGFVIVLLGEPSTAPSGLPARHESRGGGLGIGLVIGACAGIVIGFAIARQRADHSSRNKP